MHIGADYQDGACRFVVWAPYLSRLTLILPAIDQHISMDKAGGGYWTQTVEGLESDTVYLFELDGGAVKPDPASHYQPQGVFGPSQVIEHDSFRWGDRDWRGLALKDLVFYELHVGTFNPEGTLKAVLGRLEELKELGVTAVELMPLTQFSGLRNWGYDGVFPFALQNSYGRPDDLKALVDRCHRLGLALFVDFVYNHLGPEGNCLNDYGPYFPSSNMGLWGANINLDAADNEGVRNYFLENTIHWLSHYHIDGIRLDAVLSMRDSSPKHFLLDLNEHVQAFKEAAGRRIHLIAESGYNVPLVLGPVEMGGCKFDAQWLDDYQHALFALITGEREGYYRDYGGINDLVEAITEGYVYVGDQQDFRRRPKEESYPWIPTSRLVVFAQNHDQVGNRLVGDRLTTISGLEAAKLAAGLVILSPYLPLLFMGEEYGETAPFQFFTDYKSRDLIEAVRVGRRKEFDSFHWDGEMPDPQSVETFERSKLRWEQRYGGQGQKMVLYYRALLELRCRHPIFHSDTDRHIKHAAPEGKVLFIHKQQGETEAEIVANLSKEPARISFQFGEDTYVKVLDSVDRAYAGTGVSLPTSVVTGDEHQIGGFNFAVYFKEDKDGNPIG
ncbi:malto-oligosyltrehalose trehalohydrolase [Candidatus Bathyarchaeota archaeon]|nr:malto-oligosyltrehalose trehalohydrolase [Candidatus Bathyarchaeota archaeon]